jgi:hypothetical protein
MKVFSAIKMILLVSSIFCFIRGSSCFSLVFMVRKGQGKLQQSLEESDIRVMKTKGAPALNQGKGQEVTGVTLPIEVSCEESEKCNISADYRYVF